VLSQYAEREFTQVLLGDDARLRLSAHRVTDVDDFLDALDRVHPGWLVLIRMWCGQLFRDTLRWMG
jgi:hypothetical protein